MAVEIRAGNFFTAANAHFVGAVGAAATSSPINEEVIKIAVARQARRFDGVVPSELVKWRIRAGAQAGLGVELNEVNALPKRAEGQPQFAVGVQHHARIDCVERTVRVGLDDRAAIRPKVIRRGRVERGTGRQTDG